MTQVYGPDNIPNLAIATTTTVTMAATYLGKDTRITVGGQQRKYSAITINFATTGLNALDAGTIAANTLYYIYAVTSGTTPGLVASTAAPSVGPTGYASWKEIGRVRTFLGSATLAAIANRDGSVARFASGTDWASYVPTISASWGTTTSVTFQRRRIVGAYEVQGRFTAGTTTGVEGQVSLPDGFSVAQSAVLEVGHLSTQIAADSIRTVIATPGNAYVQFARTATAASLFTALAPNNIGSNMETAWFFTVNIAEFQGLYT